MSALNSLKFQNFEIQKTSESYSTNMTDSLCSSCLADYILVYLLKYSRNYNRNEKIFNVWIYSVFIWVKQMSE